METLHTTEFDNIIYGSLKHLQNYPEMIPFIGCNWNNTTYKTLLIGESHYIVKEEWSGTNPERNFFNDWYNNNSFGILKETSNYINTRHVVNKADKVNEFGFEPSLSLYYNIKNEIQNHIPSMKLENLIFPFFSFYNYFQRPSFIVGESLSITKEDEEIAYLTIKKICETIQPKNIIFISTKAKNSFYNFKNNDNENKLFEKIHIDFVPHAGSAWWNKRSATYDNQTGKEKFIKIITALS